MNKLNKGPQIEELDTRWKKKRDGKKPFAIERRYIGSVDCLEWIFATLRHWYIDRRYKTEKQRDQGLANLNRKKKDSWEYRAHGEAKGARTLAEQTPVDEDR